MLRRRYIRAPSEDPGRGVEAIGRFSEGTSFEPGHRRQVWIFRPFEVPARAWYDRLAGVFWIKGKRVGEATHWERLAPTPRQKVRGSP